MTKNRIWRVITEPVTWLPERRIDAFLVMTGLSVTQGLLAYLPIMMIRNSWIFPWVDENASLTIMGIIAHAAIDLLISVVLLHSLVFASSVRHYVSKTRDVGDVVGLAMLAVVLSAAVLLVSKGSGKEVPKELLGLKMWYGAWGLMTAYALKPIIDDLFERMYPKPSRETGQ